MVQSPPKPLTLEAFLQLPDTKPASEFIDGQILQKPMPQGKHSTIQGDLVAAINTTLKPDRIARAYPELRCTFGGRSTVPDIAVFTWERIPRNPDGKVANVFAIPPDWTIEILAPDQSQTKVVRKILHCLDHGTQLGWLIDPDEELIFVYRSDRTVYVFEDPSDGLRPTGGHRLPVPDFAAALHLTVGQLFGWLAD
jgi:Uma2 family endonuclease